MVRARARRRPSAARARQRARQLTSPRSTGISSLRVRVTPTALPQVYSVDHGRRAIPRHRAAARDLRVGAKGRRQLGRSGALGGVHAARQRCRLLSSRGASMSGAIRCGLRVCVAGSGPRSGLRRSSQVAIFKQLHRLRLYKLPSTSLGYCSPTSNCPRFTRATDRERQHHSTIS
jgi:hypothetical protein